jgi:hypothetical protein
VIHQALQRFAGGRKSRVPKPVPFLRLHRVASYCAPVVSGSETDLACTRSDRSDLEQYSGRDKLRASEWGKAKGRSPVAWELRPNDRSRWRGGRGSCVETTKGNVPAHRGRHGRTTGVPAQSPGDVKRRPRREDDRARPQGSIEAEARKPRLVVLLRVLLF